MKKILNRTTFLTGAFILVFLIGGFSTRYPYPPQSNWVKASVLKVKTLLGLTDQLPGLAEGLNLSTSRYELGTVAKGTKPGVWQLTTTDTKNVLAIERSTGMLLLMTPENLSYKETVISDSIFPKDANGISIKAVKSSRPPLLMGIHYGLNRLLYSLVMETKDKDKACQQLVMFEVPLSSLDKEPGQIIERFRTPCLADTKNIVMWAGRIASNDKKIFLSVGEQRYDRSGYPKTDMFSADDLIVTNTVFGKILEFDPATYKYKIYSSGHRNAQGLYWDNDNNELISSEHGPYGGDEVNIIVKGNNYGWPLATFGRPYPSMYPSGEPEVKDGKNPGSGVDLKPGREGYLTGSQDGYARPIMSWAPGTGIGNLLRVPMDSPLKDWRGNILAATMGETHLHRLITYKGAVIYDENIPVGVRIRDLKLLSSGDIAVSLDEGALLILRVSDI
jgi:glucose/arabinose dehydrogenase